MSKKPTGKPSPSLRREGIELNLCGRPASTELDLYEYTHRVDGLIDILNECAPPFVVGVEGEWGRGKSSFLKMVQHTLVSNEKPEWTIVPYNPWRYNIESFEDAWESMVETIANGLAGLPKKKLKSITRLVAESRLIRLLWQTAVPFSNVFAPGAKQVLGAVEAAAGAVKDYLSSAAGLGRRYAIFDDVRAKLHDLCANKRVLFLVDDLDRCQPNTVVHIFRSIATLFAPIDDSGPNFVILLGFDRRAATRAIMRSEEWDLEDASGYIDKIVNLHVTLPILEFGSGDKKRAAKNILHAVTHGGQRRSGPAPGAEKYQFEIPADRVEVIQRFMRFNPRELERFCILFDLKWRSRLKANFGAANIRGRRQGQEWIDEFRDRLIIETIIERRWPLYDSKTALQKRNSQVIRDAIAGRPVDAAGLPCEEFLPDQDFLEVYRVHLGWKRSSSNAAKRK